MKTNIQQIRLWLIGISFLFLTPCLLQAQQGDVWQSVLTHLPRKEAPKITVHAPTDPWQRYFRFKNDSNITVYPVFESPVGPNLGPNNECKTEGLPNDSVRRILVNYQQKGAGLPPGMEVTVNLPKEKPCWYIASRLLIFTANIDEFNANLPQAAQNQITVPDNLGLSNICGGDACWTGTAGAAYQNDAPAQLIEFNIDNINIDNGQDFPDRNNKSGLPAIDFDVSYVDDAYIPVALSIDDGGATYYMGTVIPFENFDQAKQGFLAGGADWVQYSAFSEEAWPYNIFHELVANTYKIPSADIFAVGTWTSGRSNYYAVPPNVGVRACSANPACVEAGLSGNCCPNDNNAQLGCCDVQAYIIEGTEKKYDNQNNVYYTSQALKSLTERWTQWLHPKGDPKDPCTSISKINTWPPANALVFNQQVKQAFCDSFRETVQFVWGQFSQANCTTIVIPEEKNQCLVAAIVGYTSQSGGQLNESVQALQRSLPWNPSAPKYQDDKFVLYWAPVDSVFNLNPYAGFVHNTIAAPGAYSFSIDDRYGNFGGKGSGLLVDIGGSSILANKAPYDPYEQFSVNLAAGWHHANICGREVQFPPQAQILPPNGKGISYPFNFWNSGNPTNQCTIILYADAAGTKYTKYQVNKNVTTVIDTYTGFSHKVTGVSFDLTKCALASTLPLVCKGTNLAAPSDNGNIVYESVLKMSRPNIYLAVPQPNWPQ